MRRRYPVKKAKPNSLRVSFGRVDGELDIAYSRDGVPKCDARLMDLHMASERYGFHGYPDKGNSLAVELMERGYDIRTLDFKISKLDESDEEGIQLNQMLLASIKGRP